MFGFNAHRRWHYTLDQQPNRHVKWFIRSIGAPQPETIMNLWASLVAFLTRTEPPWIVEAREAEEEAAAEEAAAQEEESADADKADDAASEKASTSFSVRSARALARYKRTMAATGFVGTYVVWAVFVWCVQQVQSASSLRHSRNTR